MPKETIKKILIVTFIAGIITLVLIVALGNKTGTDPVDTTTTKKEKTDADRENEVQTLETIPQEEVDARFKAIMEGQANGTISSEDAAKQLDEISSKMPAPPLPPTEKKKK
ncbi:MAG: hypothetical protein HYV45_03145 [Candidatus Moranbacteria bacterium]|nr:hypothetical protein [Candidatus Moranbacteria bacterium]